MESRRSEESEKRASEILRQKEVLDGNMARFYETIGTVSRNLRKGDWTYLHRHPEIRAIIRVIVNEAVTHQPNNIFHFAANLFDCNRNMSLVSKINKQMKWLDDQLKGSAWTPADSESPFTESSDVSLDERQKECMQSFKDMENKTAEASWENACAEPKKAECPENIKPTCFQPGN